MSPLLAEWLNLLIRWFHVLAGISWIGSSFYFMWLDSHLSPPLRTKENVTGELWMVHSGGFYQVQKHLITADFTPPVLHWFKWEAFFTWLSGIFLLLVVYYLGGGVFMIDESVAKIGVGEARIIGISLLIISWVVYDSLWNSRLGKNKNLAGVISVILVGLVIFGLSHLFSGRAAFIHVGAIFGTIMVANVWMRILPAQRQMIAATQRGEKPDYSLGTRAKLRSIHNNYLTFPLIFIMISNHFPSTYGNRQNWIILCGLILASAGVRYAMNKRTVQSRWVLLPAAAIIAALFILTTPRHAGHASTEDPDTDQGQQVSTKMVEDDSNNKYLGTLRGEVLFSGVVPTTEPIAFPPGCSDQHEGPVYSQSIASHEGRLQNVFVAITKGLEGKTFSSPQTEIVIDQRGCLYSPLVLGVQVGQPVVFLNSDPVFHNVRSISEKNNTFNEGMQTKNLKVTKIFTMPELMVHVHCDVHPWMNAFIGVLPHPFFAVTDDRGRFEIRNIPPGKYTLTAWHEVLGIQQKTIEIVSQKESLIQFTFEKSPQ